MISEDDASTFLDNVGHDRGFLSCTIIPCLSCVYIDPWIPSLFVFVFVSGLRRP